MRKGYIEEIPDAQLVGARDKSTKYEGPVAEVTYDDTWLHIETDPYEGHVMLNIEALPYLRRALSRIAKYRRRAAASIGRTETAQKQLAPTETSVNGIATDGAQ